MCFRFAPVVLIGFATLLAGCAATAPPPPPPVALQAVALQAVAGRIGVAISSVPRADTLFPGAGRGLCLASASVANSLLTDHVRVLSPRELPALKDRAAALVGARGATPVSLAESLDVQALPDFRGARPDAARKDFRGLKDRHQIDKLLVIQIDTLGISRAYTGDCVADAEPQAVFDGAAYLVDLKTNALQWYHPVHIARQVDGRWDAWPKYPQLDGAFFRALQQGRDEMLRPLQ